MKKNLLPMIVMLVSCAGLFTACSESDNPVIPEGTQVAGGSTPAAATKKKQTEIKHFNINNKNEKDSASDLWSLV